MLYSGANAFVGVSQVITCTLKTLQIYVFSPLLASLTATRGRCLFFSCIWFVLLSWKRFGFLRCWY